jgi:REP element-mobilizing transposase RayT
MHHLILFIARLPSRLVNCIFAHVSKQKSFFKNSTKEYGGDLYKTRRGRLGRRPLATRQTMHLVLKSTRAKGDLSFRKSKNAQAIKRIVDRFTKKYGIRLISLANVGNHLHFHIKLGNLRTYSPFIRAITAAIAMAVTGRSRWNKADGKFWDRRPFTRVIVGFRSWLNLQDYVRVNQMEGAGVAREQAEFIVREQKKRRSG